MADDQDLRRLIERIDLLGNRLAAVEKAEIKNRYLLLEQRRRSWRSKLSPKLFEFYQYPPRIFRVPDTYAAEVAPENAPRIAFVTPSFNSEKFLKHTIYSVLTQDYPNLDYIVQDGGSVDGTVNVLRAYGAALKWRSEPDTGQAHAINRGFQQVDGQIMGYLNSDDTLLPGTLAYVARAFLADPKIDFVYGHRIFIDEAGLEIGRCVLPPHDPVAIKWMDYVPQETMFWRREVWDKIGPLDESFQFALDWDFILRAQAAGFRFKRLPRFLGCFRVHDEQKTLALVKIGNLEQRKLRRRSLNHDPSGRELSRAIRAYLRRHILFHRAYKLRLLKY